MEAPGREARSRRGQVARAVWVLLAALLASGCVEMAIEDEIVFRRDGSGTARVTIAMDRAGLSMLSTPDQITQKLRSEVPHGVMITTRENQNWIYWDMTFSFQDPQDLRGKVNGIMRAGQGSEGMLSIAFARSDGFLRSTYSYVAELKLAFEGDAAILAPYFRGWTHRVQLPGRIVTSNGETSGGQVRWSVPADRPFRVSATSSETSIPVALLVGLVLAGAAGGGIFVLSRRRNRMRAPWCDQCGAALPPGARFCDSCGAPTRA